MARPLATADHLEAYTEHLLDGFLALREKQALLVPMLVNEDVRKAFGGPRARGLKTLRYWLFLSCVQDIVGLTSDQRNEATSIDRILAGLAQPTILGEVRERTRLNRTHYANPDATDGPEILAALEKLEQQEERERLSQFDADYDVVLAKWRALKATPGLKTFERIRHQIAAHHTSHHDGDRYVRASFKTLGISPRETDLGTTLQAMQEIVELLGRLIRRAGFAWETVDRNVEKASGGFWGNQSSPSSAKLRVLVPPTTR